MKTLIFLLAAFLINPVWCEETPSTQNGEVRVPLSAYTNMLNQLSRDPRPAPASYAIGNADVSVEVIDRDDHSTAQITISAMIEVFEDEWTLVPVLPNGTALSSVLVDGRSAQLLQGPDGLSWSTNEAGTVTMQIRYGIDIQRSGTGFVLPVAVPYAAATRLNVAFPGKGLDLAVVPGTNVQTIEEENVTRTTATIPPTSSIMISWRAPTKQPYIISRAHYSGELQGKALLWTARFDVEVFAGEPITLPLMPSGITLSDLSIDGEPAAVIEENGKFATWLQGRGMREIVVTFQVPVRTGQGPPSAHVPIPRIPVSQFDLSLPGKKELTVQPVANVVTRDAGELTEATVFMPMSDNVTFSWVEAIPDDLRAKVRANATVYHTVHAEEGVLHGRALVAYEITHGETNQLELEIPDNAQVNRIQSPSGGVSDWAVAPAEKDKRNTINVFLDREIKGEFILDITYEQLLGSASNKSITVPLLSAVNVHRQRGMVALLSGPELVLKPVTEEKVSRVGENQIPAFVRNQVKLNVTHTYKYTDPASRLLVTAAAPERKQGKFDAQVDTLISVGEATMKGSATVEVNVKSGAITTLDLHLPENVNILGVSGPSLRSQNVEPVDDKQRIGLEFTQEMQGQFRIEVSYERIMAEGAKETVVPTISVDAAEVEHGRIAVEALTTVEVRTTVAEQLSSLDINELPQQLVLKTTNPILLAHKYVNAVPPAKLALKITRHKAIDVQVAAIESASYKTLFTRDGLAVTAAEFIVRNSRRQFLRLDMPAGSEIWSVFANGKPEKPAHATDSSGTGSEAVLIKMINSAAGFPVEVVYATKTDNMRFMGNVSARLPRPDMVVTNTRWDVFLPPDHRYRKPDGTLDVVVSGGWVNPREMTAEMMQKTADGQTPAMQPLRINVPTRGIHFAFEKLYANQSEEDAEISIPYVSVEGNRIGLLLSIAGTILIWVGIVAIGSKRLKLSRQIALASIMTGIVLLVASIGQLATSPILPSILTLMIAIAIGIWLLTQRWLNRRMQRRAE